MVRAGAAVAVLVGFCGGSAVAAPARPDLVESAVTFAQHGATLVVTDAVLNRGTTAAPRSLSAYTLAGVRVGARAVPRLRAGASSHASVSVVIPRSVSPGGYRLLACADGSPRVGEAN